MRRLTQTYTYIIDLNSVNMMQEAMLQLIEQASKVLRYVVIVHHRSNNKVIISEIN